MLNATRNLVLPTTITGSRRLHGRAFKDALGDNVFRERYLDAAGVRGPDQPIDGDSDRAAREIF